MDPDLGQSRKLVQLDTTAGVPNLWIKRVLMLVPALFCDGRCYLVIAHADRTCDREGAALAGIRYVARTERESMCRSRCGLKFVNALKPGQPFTQHRADSVHMNF
jgi:hypothetical protein